MLACMLTCGFTGYSMLRINRVIMLKGVEHVWEVMLQRDAVFVNLLQYIPLLAGVLLSVVQLVPEMQRKCLKLTLHLPCSQLRMLFLMLSYGVVALLVCFGMNYLLMYCFLHPILAEELVHRILWTAATWYVAGFAGYLLVSWVILEPAWKRRIFNLLVSALVLRVFFLSDTPEAYTGFLPFLSMFTLLTSSFSWLSVLRFKEGQQD